MARASRYISFPPSMERAEKIRRLKSMYEEARAEQRTASESAMVPDDGQENRLRRIELTLEKLGASVDKPEEKSAATL